MDNFHQLYNWLSTNQLEKSKNIDKDDYSISINLFIWYTFVTKSVILVEGYIEMCQAWVGSEIMAEKYFLLQIICNFVKQKF